MLRYVTSTPLLIARMDVDVQRVYEAKVVMLNALTRDCIHIRLSPR